MGSNKHGKEAWELVADEIDYTGVMDHEIRAVERIMAKRRCDEGVENSSYYKIDKTPIPGLQTQYGYAFIYPLGASIYYSSQGDRLQQMLTIAHELGHIYYEHASPYTVNMNTSNISDPEKENEAYRFAYELIKRRSIQYGNAQFITERQFTNDEIVKRIKDIFPEYIP